MKRILSLVICLAVSLSVLPVSAFATGAAAFEVCTEDIMIYEGDLTSFYINILVDDVGDYEEYISGIRWEVGNTDVAVINEVSEQGDVVWVDFIAAGDTSIKAIHENGSEAELFVVSNAIPEIEAEGDGLLCEANEYENYYRFTPDETTSYKFEFESAVYTHVAVYDGDDTYYKCGEGTANLLDFYLEEGTEYFINVYTTEYVYEDTEEFNYSYTFSKRTGPETIKSIEITQYPYDTECYDTQLSDYYPEYLSLYVMTSSGYYQEYEIGDVAYGNEITYTVCDNPEDRDFGMVTISCGEKTADFMLDVIVSSISRITVDKAPSFVYTYGDTSTGAYGIPRGAYDPETDEYYVYPLEIDDLQFTVYYKDRTKKTYYGKDIDLYMELLDGEPIDMLFQLDAVTTGSYPVSFTLEDQTFTYDIEVRRASVTEVSVVEAPTVATYSEGFMPTFYGMKLAFEREDGTEYLTVTNDNSYLSMDIDGVIVNLPDGTQAQIVSDADVFYLQYYDLSIELPVTRVAQSPVSSIYVENPSQNFSNTKIIAYTDNSIFISLNTADLKKSEILLEYELGDMYLKAFYKTTDKGYLIFVVGCGFSDGLPAKYVVQVGDKQWEYDVTQQYTLKKISVKKKPTIVRYTVGEAFDPSGLVLTLDYGNGVTKDVYYDYDDGIEVSHVNTQREGEKTVTVYYNGLSTTFKVNVLNKFSDIPNDAWYTVWTEYVSRIGIMNGTSATTFSPDSNITRAQFVMMLANLDGVNTSDNSVKSGFSDVPSGMWYTAAIRWAKDNSIVAGLQDGTFNPDGKVTREQMCLMLVNYIENYCGYTLAKVEAGSEFTDADKIGGWAKEAVDKCQRADIINGLGDGRFGPSDNAMRCQGAVIFSKVLTERPFYYTGIIL